MIMKVGERRGWRPLNLTTLEGRSGIEAVHFDEDPEPDHVGLGPADQPY